MLRPGAWRAVVDRLQGVLVQGSGGDDAGGEAPTRREKRFVVALCALASIRVFLFSAAFPLFSNVDESAHFDLVSKYARGHVPAGLERRDADAARLLVLLNTPEYLERSDAFPGGVYPPPHRIVTPEQRPAFEREVRRWVELENHESTQPPLYYLVAAAWSLVGSAMGLAGGHGLYWIRFLDVILSALLTWLAYVVARRIFPNRPFPRVGVPLLIAFFPQDAMYLVNNDAFLPLTGGAAFLGLVLLLQGARTSYAFHAWTGLLVAAAMLVKFSNVAVPIVCLGVVAYLVAVAPTGKDRTSALTKSAVLLGVACVPIAAWCVRNYLLLGDATGSLEKARFLDWTVKPLGAMPDHPIFTLRGLAFFWQETLALFWRGEIVWGHRPLASPRWDFVYGVSSLVFVVVAVAASWTWRRDPRSTERSALLTSAALFFLSLAFLAAISVVYDFGTCIYPSRAVPYLISGRLASGSLIPFAVLYLSGVDALLPRRVPAPLRWACLIVPVAWMTVSEFIMSTTVFASAYNWFHMP